MDLMTIKQINDEAVAHFRQGNFMQAHQLTVFALRKVRELAVEDEDESHCMLFGSQEENGFKEYSLRPKATEECMEGVYNATFRLTGDIPMCVPEAAAVLLFNLALFQHRTGIKSNKGQHLEKALSLYQQAHDLLTMDGEPYSITLTVLIAAIYNNMAQIFHASFDSDNLSNMLGCLEETLSWLQPEAGDVTEDDVGFFCSNLYFARLDNFKLAPAA